MKIIELDERQVAAIYVNDKLVRIAKKGTDLTPEIILTDFKGVGGDQMGIYLAQQMPVLVPDGVLADHVGNTLK